MRKLFVVIPLTLITTMLVLSCSKDNAADQVGGTCKTTDMSFAADIQPIFNANCTYCHSSSNLSGGQDLSNYAGVLHATDNGKLLGVINHSSGYPAMPQGAAKLSDCTISKITAWIAQGKLDN